MRGFLKALVAASLATVANQASAETLNWVTYKPQGAGDPQAITTQWFADELKRRTDGEHDIRIHWGGSVAGINEIPNALENGVGDIGDVVTPYFPDQMPINNAISFFWPQPNSPIELGMLMHLWHDLYPEFSEELARYNLKVVGMRPLEAYGMICTKPVRTIEDFKGLRIRSYGFALPAIIQALGAVPVSMGTPDTYEALSRGILDCSPVGPTLGRGWKFDEVAKYYIDVPLGASWGHLITMNLEKFNSLPEEVQTELESIGREYLVRYTVEMQKQEDEIRREWREGDVEVIQFPAEEFLKTVMDAPAVQQVRQEWIDKAKSAGLEPDDIVSALAFD